MLFDANSNACSTFQSTSLLDIMVCFTLVVFEYGLFAVTSKIGCFLSFFYNDCLICSFPCFFAWRVLLQDAVNHFRIYIVYSRRRSTRLRISFSQREGRMRVLWKLRGARMLSSSRFDVPSTCTHSVCSTPRKRISWSNLFPQVSSVVCGSTLLISYVS